MRVIDCVSTRPLRRWKRATIVEGGTESSTDESSAQPEGQTCLRSAIQLMSSRAEDVDGISVLDARAFEAMESAGRSGSLTLAFCSEMSEPASPHAPPPLTAASSESCAVDRD